MKKNVILVVALFALMTGVLSAQTYDSESDFQVTKTATEVTITKYVGTKTAVNIPPRIQNLPVTKIGAQAFRMQGRLISVIIPEGVTTIGDKAFELCSALESITIPSSVNDIRTDAFAACTYLKSVTFQGTNSRGVAINAFSQGDLREKYTAGGQGTYTRAGNVWTKQGATTAAPAQSGDPESDFQVRKEGNAITITGRAGKKTVINIPSKIQNLPVTRIGNQAFGNHDDITSVTIPNSVVNIGSQAFFGCTSLTSVTIPNSVTSIGEIAFYKCPNLTSVTFQGTIPSGSFEDDAFDGIGDIRNKFYATDKAKGTPGTYTRPNGTSTVWTKK